MLKKKLDKVPQIIPEDLIIVKSRKYDLYNIGHQTKILPAYARRIFLFTYLSKVAFLES